MAILFRRVLLLLLGAYICFTCYSGYLLFTREDRNLRSIPNQSASSYLDKANLRSTVDRSDDDWNPWGEDFEPERVNAARGDPAHTSYSRQVEDNRPAKYTVEIWGKAAIGNYLWEHIFAARLETREDGALRSGSKKIGNIRFKYRTGPGIIPQTAPSDVEYLILVLNGRSKDKISFARSWLDYLDNYPRLQHTIVILLGDEQCRNGWLTRYMRSKGGKIDAAFIVYDTGLVDDHEIFQWPLGVATYRGFGPLDSHKLDIESSRPYKCNFLGTVYPKSSRKVLMDIISRQNGLNKACFTKPREEWLPNETSQSLQMYQYALSLSDLTLNPVGMNTECYRIYEAMAYGSVPVVEDKTTPGLCQNPALRLLKKHKAPFIYVKNWITDFPRILGQEAALSLKEKIERRVALVEWYEGFKLDMRKLLIDIAKRKFGLTD
ncbi:ribitol-5-phosphate xylosyltransferase 1 [Galendromus occidentalis]|uniref:Ribitol-5-phosphate xylosyltransferase 1 n=1 Tax=Galendromus occidentalis TaxID=34638 RepID=A0AAJ6QRH5_9ACAR|nr:ribitol-5-phosphate xylosyltransferase 1 [Galendromus occidentalis]